METVVLVDWPRVGYHRGEILKGLVGCWLRVEEEGEGEGREEGGKEEAKRKGELRDVKDGIRRCVKLLTAVLVKEVDVGGEYRLLVESDGRLGGLLVV
jgi:tRNA nucleotidyltransferase (CCA-adding enzyme)